MTRTTNSRIAGFTFLFYIATGITSMLLFGKATNAEDIAAKLAGIAQHATFVRVIVVLGLSTCFCAIVLGVTLYSITRDQDRDLAMLAMICRVGEGVIGGAGIQRTLGVLWLGRPLGQRHAMRPSHASATGIIRPRRRSQQNKVLPTAKKVALVPQPCPSSLERGEGLC